MDKIITEDELRQIIREEVDRAFIEARERLREALAATRKLHAATLAVRVTEAKYDDREP